MALKELAVEQRLLREGPGVVVFLPPRLELRVRVAPRGQGLEPVGQGVANGVRKGGLLPPDYALRDQPLAREGPAQEVFAHAVAVQLELRVYGHDVAHEVQVPEGYARFQ